MGLRADQSDPSRARLGGILAPHSDHPPKRRDPPKHSLPLFPPVVPVVMAIEAIEAIEDIEDIEGGY